MRKPPDIFSCFCGSAANPWRRGDGRMCFAATLLSVIVQGLICPAQKRSSQAVRARAEATSNSTIDPEACAPRFFWDLSQLCEASVL